MKLRSIILLSLAPMLLLAPYANAAFCALRDPVETIHTLFPAATSHKSVIRVVGEEQRDEVSKRLPPNSLHFSELGQHTLYLTYKGKQPLGYLHVRSEESEWGLVEVAWAISLDLKVKDFRFQRCRSRAKREIESDEFREQLIGKSYTQLRQLLAADGVTVNAENVSVSKAGESLAGVVLRCALKTLLVTELVWADEIEKNAIVSRAMLNFQDASSMEELSDLKLAQHYDSILSSFPGNTTAMSLAGSELFALRNSTGQAVGAVFRHSLNLYEQPEAVEWHIDPEGKVVSIGGVKNWPDEETKLAFDTHINSSFNNSTTCTDRPTLLTKQAVLMSMLAFRS